MQTKTLALSNSQFNYSAVTWIFSNKKSKFRFLKKKFSIRISSINVTKSAANCGFGHINWRNS